MFKYLQKPLLFFLHGVGCSADLWFKLIKHFANEGYEIAAPDMLGHGYSSAPDIAALYEFHHLLKDTIDIFDKFVNDQRKCVVIGHSYGYVIKINHFLQYIFCF